MVVLPRPSLWRLRLDETGNCDDTTASIRGSAVGALVLIHAIVALMRDDVLEIGPRPNSFALCRALASCRATERPCRFEIASDFERDKLPTD